MLTVAGVGPGNPRYLTVDVVEKIKEAETIIAFGRVGHSIKTIRDDYIEVNRVDQVIEILDKDREPFSLHQVILISLE